MGAFQDFDSLTIAAAKRGGFALLGKQPSGDDVLVGVASDDEGLMEWLGEQLAFSGANKDDEMKALSADLETVQTQLDETQRAYEGAKQAHLEALETLGKSTEITIDLQGQLDTIRKALAPFERLAFAGREKKDDDVVGCEWNEATGGFVFLNYPHLRDLLKAAGLFTDEMLPRPPNPAAEAKQAEASDTPPPAERLDDEPDADGADAPAGGDNLVGQRMDSADVGEDAEVDP